MGIRGRGARVWQATYGHGTIVESDRAHIRIEFDDHGPRTFSAALVTLEASVVPAPKRAPRRRASGPGRSSAAVTRR